MALEHTHRIPARLQVLAATALLLERLEQLPRTASADQYRGLVRQLDQLLEAAEGEPFLHALLAGLPALDELHENRHYARIGLSRAPLAEAVQAEQMMLELLDRLRCHH